MSLKVSLLERIESKKSKIGIIGIGFVGLPLCICFAKAGYKVLGFDIDKNKVELLNSGVSYINHIESSLIKDLRSKNLFETTIDFSRASEVDALIICVPTPLTNYKEPDLSYIEGTISALKNHLRSGQIISLESTTYPGTTDEKLKPIIEEKGFKIGEDFFLIYSPEREDPGNTKFTTTNIPKIIGGITSDCTDVGIALYKAAIDELVPVTSTRVAEMTKLLENIQRAVNIGLMNEMKMISDRMNIDLYEVIEAASTKPFGFTTFYPGPGLGGHCIPVDPFYLTWKARAFGFHTRFIELAGEINAYMPSYVVQKVSDALNNKSKSIKGCNALILGLSYKKNVEDMRESPSIEIVQLLQNKGANTFFDDPFYSKFPIIRKKIIPPIKVNVKEINLKEMDVIILVTDHDDFDYDYIKKNSDLIVDTRGRYISSMDVVRA